MFTPGFRHILWKSLGLTILLLVATWIVLEAGVSTILAPMLGSWPWLATAIVWLMGVGMFIGAGFLIAPVAAIFAGLFLDDVAQHVEGEYYPSDKPGSPLPIGDSLYLAAKFTLVVVGANLFALMLVLLPGINFAVFFLVNGYLLGREYFIFAALRFRNEKEANDLRRANSTSVMFAGLIIAGFMAVPILNLFTPIFAASMMVHMHKSLSGSQPERAFNATSQIAD